MFEDLKNLNRNQTLTTIFGFLGVLAPGFLIIYLYKPDLFLSLDTIKLLIFAVSLSGPIFVINMIFLMNTPPDTKNQYVSAIIGLFLAAIILYFGILAAYLFTLSFKVFLSIIGVLQAVTIVALRLYDIRCKKRA